MAEFFFLLVVRELDGLEESTPSILVFVKTVTQSAQPSHLLLLRVTTTQIRSLDRYVESCKENQRTRTSDRRL